MSGLHITQFAHFMVILSDVYGLLPKAFEP